ncbi:MAG: CoA transferase, partial [Alphaproteobacteria bacterium]
VINILLALREAERTGKGTHLDIAMCDNVLAWQYWAIATAEAEGRTPVPGRELVTGGSPRYRIYRTADGRFAAIAALEEKFWDNLCDLLDLPAGLRDDSRDQEATAADVARIIASKPAAHWRKEFAARDVCCSIVQDMAEAMADPHFRARGLFGRRVTDGPRSVTAIPVPVVPQFRSPQRDSGYPHLGDANAMLDDEDG